MTLFSKISFGLKKSSSRLSTGIAEIFTKKRLDASALESLEDLLIMADVGAVMAAEIVAEIAQGRVDKDISENEVKALLAAAIARRLAPYATSLDVTSATPHVIVMVGVNGNGKTTTIGKLAHHYQRQGKRVMLAAADTFRAAAVEQLQQWAERANVPCVTGAANSDPAALAFQATERAVKERVDLLLIDTAGRLQTKAPLMAELEKIRRVIGKALPGAPHQVIQVLDATTGQNALTQVEAFRETAGVTGLIITKLDGTAKAGIVLALTARFGLPIQAIGVGEGIDDLQAFDAREFARALVG
ncbi:MAG: signal recognition particle-docking protein FtsY [Alphaproteobacteria bacterium]|jgi:fused signal recognition particle receptor